MHAVIGRKAASRAAEAAQQQDDVWETFAGSLHFLASLPSTSLTQDEIARAKVERNNVRAQCANLHVTVPDQ